MRRAADSSGPVARSGKDGHASPGMFRLRIAHKFIGFSALAAGLSFAPLAASAADKPPCQTKLDAVRLASPLTHLGVKLTRHEPVTIVAIGSSSTFGAGASSREATYPSRLQAELKLQFPDSPITVLNRGVSGEEVPDMLKRFDNAVVAAKPDLVIWQLGTNSVLRDHMSDQHSALIRDGLKRIRATGADVVLIDPQFAPQVISKAQAPRMVALIAATAKAENVDLFPRFQVMKQWAEGDHLAFGVFTSPDGLHMNDWGYSCLAKGLTAAITEAAKRPVLSAKVVPVRH
jgi:acyl-CoA thioesterase-1